MEPKNYKNQAENEKNGIYFSTDQIPQKILKPQANSYITGTLQKCGCWESGGTMFYSNLEKNYNHDSLL